MLLLLVPNLIWTKNMPQGYTASGERKLLQIFERVGEAAASCCALLFSDFNLRPWTARSWWLVAALACMALYELWWIRYFRSARRLEDFYSGILGVPLAGATLPVAAFFLLGLYGKVVWMLLSAAILGVGHIGIHWEHKKQLQAKS